MQELTIKVYNVNELSKEVRKKVIDKHRDFNTCPGWSIEYIDEFEFELENLGYEGSGVQYSGFHSQGSGACFDATISLSIVGPRLGFKIKKFWETLEDNNISIVIDKNSFSTYYSHSKTRNIFIENKSDYNRIDKILDDLKDSIAEEYISICDAFYKKLNDIYNDLTEDDSIIKQLIENNYQFMSNGVMID